MSKYAECALRAVNLIESNKANNPKDAWEIASIELFGEGTPSQRKGCPKNAFLGLCEEGIVKGVLHGNYTTSKKNKDYAVKAIEILKREPELKNNPKELWNRVIGDIKKSHNSQMDVVTTLWINELIEV